MNSRSFYRMLLFAILSIILVALFYTASSFTTKRVADFWDQLGITRVQGNDRIRNSFASGYVNTYGLKNAKNIALDQRGAVARDLLGYTKNYLAGAEFKQYYATQRSQSRPAEPAKETKTKEQVRQDLIANLENTVKEAEKTMAKLAEEYKKGMQESITNTKKQIEEYRQPDNKIVEIIYQGEVSTHKANWERYHADVKKWETRYPEDVRVLIRNRLMKYLELAGTVDFDAQLTEKYGKLRFVNPVYESKSNDWKMIFRAGKEVNAITIPLVNSWLKELE